MGTQAIFESEFDCLTDGSYVMNLSNCDGVESCLIPFCGRLCGKSENGTSIIGECGPCPWGWKVDNFDRCSLCQPCEDEFEVYDWLFVFFNMLILYLIHVQAIFRFSVQTYQMMLFELFCAALEIIFGFIISICFFPPFGSLKISACFKSA